RRRARGQGPDRLGHVHLGRARVGSVGARGAALERTARRLREYRGLCGRPIGVPRAQARRPRRGALPLMSAGQGVTITVLGVNHVTAPLEVRERFWHANHEVPAALQRVLAAGAHGGVLLSTCNRTEFYLADDGNGAPAAVWALLTERLGDG